MDGVVVQESTQHSMESQGFGKKLRNGLAAVYSYLSFSIVRPIIDKGHKNELNEQSAAEIRLDTPSIKQLAEQFDSIYKKLQVYYGEEKSQKKNLVIRAIALQYWPLLLFHFFWVILETAVRLSGPLLLRQFLLWIEDYNEDRAEYYEGWLWGLLLSTSGFVYMLIHHRYVWQGAIIGYRAKFSLIALVHEKLLRLSSSMISKLTAGHIVNLVSNDVKRFEMTFILWLYIIIGPLETVIVLFMVSSVLGFLPAISGLGCMLLLIPIQAFLSAHISKFRRQTAEVTDERVNSMGELITGSLAIKMLVWEDPFMDKINSTRQLEDKLLKIVSSIKANSMALFGYGRTVMICVTMIVLRFTREEFDIPDVFFAISLLTLPQLTMTMFFAVSVQQLSELIVSTQRIDAFFKITEPSPISNNDIQSSDKGEITITSGCYGWHKDKASSKNKIKPSKSSNQLSNNDLKSEKEESASEEEMVQTLSDIEFDIRPGELVGVVGKVGSGKSSILNALLNDMEVLSHNSSVHMSGTVAYCAQVPFIIAATVRENIIFGQPFDEVLYQNVIWSCALNVDIEQLPLGDATILGERGINLSGGQKARVALARAAYCNADINLLDDPLSAVDPRVGRILFDRCIGGTNALMRNSTRLLVTHQRQFLSFCDRIILMDDGRIECIDTWDHLQNHEQLKVEKQSNTREKISLDTSNEQDLKDNETKELNVSNSSLDDNTQERNLESVNDPNMEESSRQLVQDESKESGRVSKRVYLDYIGYIGVFPITLSLSILILSKVIYFGAEWWIANWASTDEEDQRDHKWIWVLISLTLTVVILVSIATFSIFILLVHGSTQLHGAMVKRVLHAPLKFFHMNPTGRILNRFSKDLGMQDEELPLITADVLIISTQLIGTLVIILIALPYIAPLFILIAYIFSRIQKKYIVPSREIKRYDGLTRSPVYAMFSLNMKGVSTIRAYEKEKDFQKAILNTLDLNSSWWLSFMATSRWFGFRLDGISLLIAFSAIVAAIIASKIVSEEILALALTNALGLSGALQWCMRQVSEMENVMTAVERNVEYTRLEQEPSKASEGGGEAPGGWPVNAHIEFISVTASYRPGLDPVLNNISFVIPGGRSVGIVGRTGSGKSSLLLTLFRLIDVNKGSILIDGVDTSTIGIDVLRKQIAVIPQDPVLFSGTFRSNMDPWKEYSDGRLWQVLQKVHLDSAVSSFGGLDAPISESGNNLSVGQRQLLCLARALLGDSKILALDEATANVDHLTDSLIQQSLHSLISEKEKTLLIIAHRIDTIMDCDLLIVMENGRVVEFGSPIELLEGNGGTFKSMVKAAKRASKMSIH
eukprot:g7111.t1